MNRLAGLLSAWILSFLGRLGTPEQKKVWKLMTKFVQHKCQQQFQRNREVQTKMEKLTFEVIGDRIKDMIYVDLLATQPQSQGHGYGGALLDTVTSLVCQLA